MPPPLQELHGIEGLAQMYSMTIAPCSDWNEQKGPFGPFPASGKSFKATIIGIHRIANGKIAETWVAWDNVAWLTQLGHLPPPEEK
jgi:predicted ester cyclase